MVNKKAFWILGTLVIVLISLYIFYGISEQNFAYFFPRRFTRVLAILLAAFTISVSTVIFQALTNNRILTPSMLGFDSLYMLMQTALLVVFGAGSVLIMHQMTNFLVTLVIMVSGSVVLYGVLFKKMGHQLISMLLIGIVLSTLFRSVSSFFQMILDPNEFSIIQDRSFASFNNMNTDILWIALALSLIVFIFLAEDFMKLDIMALGKEHAINLGLRYDFLQKKYLIAISILIAISTALVGPIMFLGLLVVNIARQISSTYKQTNLIWLSFLLSVVFLVGGQFLLERILNFALPLSIIINFVGGAYMLYLLKKEMTI